jgi:hypothetical protein
MMLRAIQLTTAKITLYGALWGFLLTIVASLSLLFWRGDTHRQRLGHSIFRWLFIITSLNFTLAWMPEPYKTLEDIAPSIPRLQGYWLMTSAFLIPLYPLAEIFLMRRTRSIQKKRALVMDCLLASVYVVTMTVSVLVTSVGSGI